MIENRMDKLGNHGARTRPAGDSGVMCLWIASAALWLLGGNLRDQVRMDVAAGQNGGDLLSRDLVGANRGQAGGSRGFEQETERRNGEAHGVEHLLIAD